ncbi:hypothetical protein [uncultured Flavobacterium sp.]|uniref:hypothetical protein n=1 Tax=uncultured Flavobacterium sp. TaxID=165435 RepID=UPI0025E0D757|nr:hypothetical protein [uncultured Flavobacterium sp.]
MRHHINIIALAVRAAIVIASCMAFIHLAMAVLFHLEDGQPLVKQFFSGYFTPLTKATPYHNNEWYGSAFCIVYAALLIYCVTGLQRFQKGLKRIKKGYIFEEGQDKAFRNAAASVIIFAKSKYLLFCTMGSLLYFDLTIFFREIPSFLAIYLIGKFMYLISGIAEKGAFIRQENELTI